MGGRRHLPLRPLARPATRCSPSTRRRRRSAARCTSATCSATPTPTPSPAIQRMRGKQVFYPIGWDDNGLATERRVQNFSGVRCDPSLPYDPDFEPPFQRRSAEGSPRDPGQPARTSSSCASEPDRRRRGGLRGAVRRLGLSVDWSLLYTTIGERAQRASQRGVPAQPRPRRGVPAGRADAVGHRLHAPPSPRPRWKTARSPGAYHKLAFHRSRRRAATSSSTRPGPSCWPAASRSSPTPTTRATSRCSAPPCVTPLFGVEVPVVAHHLADPEKGTGIAMICTFGDITDVTWWRELNLPSRALIGLDGRLRRRHARWITDADGQAAYARARRLGAEAGAAQIVELLHAIRRAARRAAPDQAPGQVLRAGRRAAGDRRHPAVVHPQRRPRRRAARRAPRTRRRAQLAPAAHAATATRTGSTGSTATG